MKKSILLAVALALACSVFATTTSTTPTGDSWQLKRGSTNIGSPAAAEATCWTAARADAESRQASANYSCVDAHSARITYSAFVCPGQPTADTQTVTCPAGTTGTWTQVRNYTTAPAPTCWIAGAWTPASAPAGACPAAPPPPPPPTGALLMSPTGADSGDCKTTPCLTFAYVFSKLAAGGELILMDGTYASAINWQGPAGSAQIPSGTAASPTYVHAANPGKAVVPGIFIGRRTRKDSYIKVQGIRSEGDVSLYNTSFVTIKEVGIHGAMDVGTNDHDQGNTDNLIEDVWVWADQRRIIAINYRAHRTVWRRMVVRGDGCGTAACTGDGNPNVGFTVYDSHDVSVQNVIVLDRVLNSTDSPYSDFAIASHTGGLLYTFGRNEWLGTISLNAPDTGYYMEPDYNTTETPTIKMLNVVAWNSAYGGYNLDRESQDSILENMTLNSKGQGESAFRISPDLQPGASGKTVSSAKNLLLSGSGRWAVNSSVQASYVSLTGTWSDAPINLTAPQQTPINLISSPASALKYITRIEAGSPLKGSGAGGADIGANVLFRYGSDGSRFGDPGYNALGTASIWPWPNEARIKAEMCAATTRGFCSTGKRLDGVNPVTLSSYVWEAIGNPAPAAFAP